MIGVIGVFGFNHLFWSKIVPVIIFGTSRIHYTTDYFVSKFPLVVMIAVMSGTIFFPSISHFRTGGD